MHKRKHDNNSINHSSPDSKSDGRHSSLESKSDGSVLGLNQVYAVDVKQIADKEYYAFIDYLTVNEKGKFRLII